MGTLILEIPDDIADAIRLPPKEVDRELHKILHLGRVKKRPYGFPFIKQYVPITDPGFH